MDSKHYIPPDSFCWRTLKNDCTVYCGDGCFCRFASIPLLFLSTLCPFWSNHGLSWRTRHRENATCSHIFYFFILCFACLASVYSVWVCFDYTTAPVLPQSHEPNTEPVTYCYIVAFLFNSVQFSFIYIAPNYNKCGSAGGFSENMWDSPIIKNYSRPILK